MNLGNIIGSERRKYYEKIFMFINYRINRTSSSTYYKMSGVSISV